MAIDNRVVIMKTKKTHLIDLLLLLILLCFLSACKDDSSINDSADSNDYIYVIPEETGDGWETASLNSVGINTSILEDLIKDINRNIYQEVR